MKMFLVLSLGLISIFLNAQSINLKSGWQLKGTEVGFNDMNSFKKDCIKTVWRYNDIEKKWEAFSPKEAIQEKIKNSMFVSKLDKINPNDGFWIFADNNCTIESNSTTHDINLSRGLVAWYQFEGNANDSSGNGNDGVEHGGVTYVDGVIGKAKKFINSLSYSSPSSEHDYISIPNSIDSNKFSISLWVKFNKLSYKDSEALFSYGQDGQTTNKEFFAIWIDKDSKIYVSEYDSNGKYISLEGIKIGTEIYHNIQITNSNNKLTLYIDSNLIDQNNSLRIKFNQTNYLLIGSHEWWNYSKSTRFNGFIDDLRIYNRILNENEIKALYNMGKK